MVPEVILTLIARDDMNAEDPVIELSDDEARDFLASQRFGRLAMVLIDEPEIVPVNFVLSTEGEHGDTIYINTAQGNKLFAAAVGRTLAFEADEVGEEFATSAIAYGNGRIVNTTEEADLAARLGLRAWVATYKSSIVAIDISRMSGRRFRLGPPPANPVSEVPG